MITGKLYQIIGGDQRITLWGSLDGTDRKSINSMIFMKDIFMFIKDERDSHNQKMHKILYKGKVGYIYPELCDFLLV